MPSGRPRAGAAFHSGFRRARAVSATSGSAWSTATRPSFSTTVTPSTFAASEESTRTRVAPWAGGRSSRACSSPGRRMSPAYAPAPVTLSTPSRRRGERPMTLNSGTARRTAFSSSVRVIAWPFARAP